MVEHEPETTGSGRDRDAEPLPVLSRDPCLWWWLDGMVVGR